MKLDLEPKLIETYSPVYILHSIIMQNSFENLKVALFDIKKGLWFRDNYKPKLAGNSWNVIFQYNKVAIFCFFPEPKSSNVVYFEKMDSELRFKSLSALRKNQSAEKLL